MARKPRIEFEGAVYHVIQRGGSRRPVFGAAESARAFEICLFEVGAGMGWRLHAYALLPSGFHLAIETPRANLVAGMRRLLSTHSLRERRSGRERGRRFAGRYRAILIEPGPALSETVDAIHLSPVRAGLVPAGLLERFRWSSCRRWSADERPAFLTCRAWRDDRGEAAETAESKERYLARLASLAAEPAREGSFGSVSRERGWAVGSPVWREAIARRYLGGAARSASEREAGWSESLDRFLGESGRTRVDAAAEPKGTGWKIEIAGRLRNSTTATNEWIARELNMGAASSVSVYLTRRRVPTA